MQYIGNFQTWLPQHAIDTILSIDGDRRPEHNPESYKSGLANLWSRSGINFYKVGWTLYYQSHFNKKITIPEEIKNVSNWWFCKLNPGDMFPLHQDLYKEPKPVKRYWMACQDHMPGHVFFYGKESLNNYRAGDLFLFENENEWHGACNLGFVPKISLQIVCDQ